MGAVGAGRVLTGMAINPAAGAGAISDGGPGIAALEADDANLSMAGNLICLYTSPASTSAR
jgi:hypothetical protein